MHGSRACPARPLSGAASPDPAGSAGSAPSWDLGSASVWAHTPLPHHFPEGAGTHLSESQVRDTPGTVSTVSWSSTLRGPVLCKQLDQDVYAKLTGPAVSVFLTGTSLQLQPQNNGQRRWGCLKHDSLLQSSNPRGPQVRIHLGQGGGCRKRATGPSDLLGPP